MLSVSLQVCSCGLFFSGLGSLRLYWAAYNIRFSFNLISRSILPTHCVLKYRRIEINAILVFNARYCFCLLLRYCTNISLAQTKNNKSLLQIAPCAEVNTFGEINGYYRTIGV